MSGKKRGWSDIASDQSHANLQESNQPTKTQTQIKEYNDNEHNRLLDEWCKVRKIPPLNPMYQETVAFQEKPMEDLIQLKLKDAILEFIRQAAANNESLLSLEARCRFLLNATKNPERCIHDYSKGSCCEIFEQISKSMRTVIGPKYEKVQQPTIRQEQLLKLPWKQISLLLEVQMVKHRSIETSEQHQLYWCLVSQSAFSAEHARIRNIKLDDLRWSDITLWTSNIPGKIDATIIFRNKDTMGHEMKSNKRPAQPKEGEDIWTFQARSPDLNNIIFSVPHRLLAIANRRQILGQSETIDQLMSEKTSRQILVKPYKPDFVFFRTKKDHEEISNNSILPTSDQLKGYYLHESNEQKAELDWLNPATEKEFERYLSLAGYVARFQNPILPYSLAVGNPRTETQQNITGYSHHLQGQSGLDYHELTVCEFAAQAQKFMASLQEDFLFGIMWPKTFKNTCRDCLYTPKTEKYQNVAQKLEYCAFSTEHLMKQHIQNGKHSLLGQFRNGLVSAKKGEIYVCPYCENESHNKIELIQEHIKNSSRGVNRGNMLHRMLMQVDGWNPEDSERTIWIGHNGVPYSPG